MIDAEKKAQGLFDYFKECGISLAIRTEIVPVVTQRELWHITLNDDVNGGPMLSDYVVNSKDVMGILDMLKEDYRDDAWKNRQKPATAWTD